MNKFQQKILLGVVFTLIINTNVYSQSSNNYFINVVTDTVIVTGSRLGSQFSAGRNISIISRDEIANISGNSISDILNYASGVSMNSRGMSEVQSDPSLRGAGFEQVLILLNGVRMNDPQSGHHNMNLPISVSDIERVEILKGQGSAIYGPDAFGGVINIITIKPESNSTSIEVSGGTWGTGKSNISQNFSIANFRNRLSIGFARSDGYRKSTDYENININLSSSYSDERKSIDVIAGYIEKKFGANEFYVANFDSYEEISSKFLGVKSKFDLNDKLTLNINNSFKEHKDFFNLSIENPSFYQADHTTNRIDNEALFKYKSENYGNIIWGFNLTSEDITSSTLGNHDVDRKSVFGEYGNVYNDNIIFTGGLRYDNHSEWGNQINPSLSIGYIVSDKLNLKSSIGRSFRAPTFIELYNPSPANVGNKNLVPEKALSLDFGFEYIKDELWTLETSVFYRDQSETIDWIKDIQEVNGPWRAVNLFDIETFGIENNFKIHVSEKLDFKFNYLYLNQEKSRDDIESKYVFNQPNKQLTFSTDIKLNDIVDLHPYIVWKQRDNLGDSKLINLKVNFKLETVSFYIQGINLTDEEYNEVKGVPMPGRYFMSGFKFKLNQN